MKKCFQANTRMRNELIILQWNIRVYRLIIICKVKQQQKND